MQVCGCVEPEEKDPIKYNNTYIERFNRFRAAGGLNKVDVQGVKALLDQSGRQSEAVLVNAPGKTACSQHGLITPTAALLPRSYAGQLPQ